MYTLAPMTTVLPSALLSSECVFHRISLARLSCFLLALSLPSAPDLNGSVGGASTNVALASLALGVPFLVMVSKPEMESAGKETTSTHVYMCTCICLYGEWVRGAIVQSPFLSVAFVSLSLGPSFSRSLALYVLIYRNEHVWTHKNTHARTHEISQKRNGMTLCMSVSASVSASYLYLPLCLCGFFLSLRLAASPIIVKHVNKKPRKRFRPRPVCYIRVTARNYLKMCRH